MKPILRWTIGPVDKAGFQVLAYSVKLAKRIYKEFDFYICHNGLSKPQLKILDKLEINLIYQQGSGLSCVPYGVAWKLYPPRLDISRHEIFIDNDLVLFRPLEEVDWFLAGDKRFIATEGLIRLFGTKDWLVPRGVKINSGFFGIPPYFDFGNAIDNINELDCWSDRYNEQGVVATIVCRHEHRIIPIKKVSVCLDSFVCGTHGIHFCGINSGLRVNWNKFFASRYLC